MANERYVESLYPEDADLERAKETIRAKGMPEISIPFAYGKLLTLLAAMSGAKRALEIGALGGYSGTCIARGLPADGQLVSLELDPAFAEVARSQLEASGLGSKVSYRIGEALRSLEALEAEGEKFDFFFIDADKGNYPAYLEKAIALANPGAVIAGDNAFAGGRIADESIDTPTTRAMRVFNRTIATDPRLDSIILPAHDGLAIARVKA